MSRMLDEAREAPEAVARQLAADRDRWRSFGARLRQEPMAPGEETVMILIPFPRP